MIKVWNGKETHLLRRVVDGQLVIRIMEQAFPHSMRFIIPKFFVGFRYSGFLHINCWPIFINDPVKWFRLLCIFFVHKLKCITHPEFVRVYVFTTTPHPTHFFLLLNLILRIITPAAGAAAEVRNLHTEHLWSHVCSQSCYARVFSACIK